MSQYFYVGDEVVWNPSNDVGRLFLRSAQALAPDVELGIGISPADHIANADVWAIDLPVFKAFVDALVDRYQSSSHVILRSLIEGFIATALVMIERGGGQRTNTGRLAELRTVHSGAMPT